MSAYPFHYRGPMYAVYPPWNANGQTEQVHAYQGVPATRAPARTPYWPQPYIYGVPAAPVSLSLAPVPAAVHPQLNPFDIPAPVFQSQAVAVPPVQKSIAFTQEGLDGMWRELGMPVAVPAGEVTQPASEPVSASVPVSSPAQVPARVDDLSHWIDWDAGEDAPSNEAPRPKVDVNIGAFLLSPIASNLPALGHRIDSSEPSPTQPTTPEEAALKPLLLRACDPRLVAGAQPNQPAQPAHATQPTKGKKVKRTANAKPRAPPTPSPKRNAPKTTRPRKAPATVTGDPLQELVPAGQVSCGGHRDQGVRIRWSEPGQEGGHAAESGCHAPV